jgi:hypothetical protein
MKMKNLTVQKRHHSMQSLQNKDNGNNPGLFKTSIGLALNKYEKSEQDLEDAHALAILKDSTRSNTTGTDDDLAIDIQEAIDRDTSLSLVANNILVTVEDGIVTLEGEVYRDQEKMTAGDLAAAFAGEDDVNNYLRVANSAN